MWKIKFGLVLVLMLVFPIVIECKKVNNAVNGRSYRFSMDDLLTNTFPYSDPRTDNQIYMDPCKAGIVEAQRRKKFRNEFNEKFSFSS